MLEPRLPETDAERCMRASSFYRCEGDIDLWHARSCFSTRINAIGYRGYERLFCKRSRAAQCRFFLEMIQA